MVEPVGSDARSASIDVWMGTSLGVVKGVSLATKQSFNFLPGALSLAQTDKSREVCVMCWEHASREQLYLGLRNGTVQCFSCEGRTFTAECDCTGGVGRLIGLGKHEDVLITCTDDGNLSFWPGQEEKTQCSVGKSVHKMAASPDVSLLVATGGRENELKLWDEKKLDEPLFMAKNVRPDFLDLRVPVWVTEIAFLPGSGAQPTLVTGTGHHQVRLYDTRAQRRPVFSTEFGESPITALDVLEDGRSFMVGNGEGDIARFDLRKGVVLNRYKGFCGGVKSLQCFREDDHLKVASCGLDRYLRVYSVQPPKLLHQMYVKLQCNCLLVCQGSEARVQPSTAEAESSELACAEDTDDSEEKEEEDELWAAMETVGSKRATKGEARRKRALNRREEEPGKTSRKKRLKHL